MAVTVGEQVPRNVPAGRADAGLRDRSGFRVESINDRRTVNIFTGNFMKIMAGRQ